MKAEEVAQFLNQHPEFFEDYAEMLAEVVIPHPHGGRAIPISERQILSLREKARRLEAKLGELIRFGEQNDAITDKLHRMTLALIAARDVDMSTLRQAANAPRKRPAGVTPALWPDRGPNDLFACIGHQGQ